MLGLLVILCFNIFKELPKLFFKVSAPLNNPSSKYMRVLISLYLLLYIDSDTIFTNVLVFLYIPWETSSMETFLLFVLGSLGLQCSCHFGSFPPCLGRKSKLFLSFLSWDAFSVFWSSCAWRYPNCQV